MNFKPGDRVKVCWSFDATGGEDFTGTVVWDHIGDHIEQFGYAIDIKRDDGKTGTGKERSYRVWSRECVSLLEEPVRVEAVDAEAVTLPSEPDPDGRPCVVPPAPKLPSESTPYYAQKADRGKLRWSLVIGSLFAGLKAVVRVRMFGVAKYGRDNGWREVSDCDARYREALLRHAASYASGERVDDESGEPTLAHLVCDALFLLTLDEERKADPNVL